MMRRLATLLTVMTLGAGLFLVGIVSAQDADGPVAVITGPTEGQQLFGQVTITGSAYHAAMFGSYTLEYNNLREPGSPWFLVQPRVQQQVQDGVLGTWNTNLLADGPYALRLSVFLTDGQVAEFVVSNLRVINSEPTPVPTVAGELMGTADAPTPGPSPTSPIEQPPSNNPSGIITGLDDPGGGSDLAPPPNTAPETETTTRINTDRIRGAFCGGVYLTLGVFGVMLVYLVIRGRLRPFTRRLLWQIQDEMNSDH